MHCGGPANCHLHIGFAYFLLFLSKCGNGSRVPATAAQVLSINSNFNLLKVKQCCDYITICLPVIHLCL